VADSSAIKDGLRNWKQGDVVRPAPFIFVADGSAPATPTSIAVVDADPGEGWRSIETDAAGIVVISQTCDIVSKNPDEAPFVVFAALTALSGSIQKSAAKGDRPRYVPIPQLGDEWFADLDKLVTVEKGALVDIEHEHGVLGTKEEADFGEKVARKFGRFAFPDDVSLSLRSVTKRIKDRHDSDTSSEGRLLQMIEEVRLRGRPSWSVNSGLEVDVIFILKAAELMRPGPDEPPLEPSASTGAWYSAAKRKPPDIAQRIHNSSDAADISWLWDRLGDAWAELCEPLGVVSSVTAYVICADDMTVSEYWDTQSADLDYLSLRDRSLPS
jgi:hypothetical protein